MVGTDGPDLLTGGPGSDVIVGLDGDDVIDGGGGRDFICGGNGDDIVGGGPGRDRIKGMGGDDELSGGPGKDRLIGGKGRDDLAGEGGKDTLTGGPGPDTTDGGSGVDRCDGETARACEGMGSGKRANPDLVTMEFYGSVSRLDRESITAGVAIMHHYLESYLGGDEAATWQSSNGKPLAVSISASDGPGCCYGLSAGAYGLFEPGPRLYVENWTWTPGPAHYILHMKDSAHEYFHSWQGALGCVGGATGNPLGNWLTEGLTEYAAWNAVVEAGLMTEQQVVWFHLNAASTGLVAPDLAAWEDNTAPFDYHAYSYSFLAATRLVNQFGGPTILRDFCEVMAEMSRSGANPDPRCVPWGGAGPSAWVCQPAVAFDRLGIDRLSFYGVMDEYFDQVADWGDFRSTWPLPEHLLHGLLLEADPPAPPPNTVDPPYSVTASPGNHLIEGLVVSSSGRPPQMYFAFANGSAYADTDTDALGRYHFDLPPGTYVIEYWTGSTRLGYYSSGGLVPAAGQATHVLVAAKDVQLNTVTLP